MLKVVAGCLAGGTFLALATLWWARRWPDFEVGKRTRSRSPRGVDPALALVIRTGLKGNGLITASLVVPAELVHRRVINTATDGEDLWRLKYTDRAATLALYEKLLLKTLFGRNSRTTLNLETLRSIAPAIARELRNDVRQRGWDRPLSRPARWPEHYLIVPDLTCAGGLTTFFALIEFIGGHRWKGRGALHALSPRRRAAHHDHRAKDAQGQPGR